MIKVESLKDYLTSNKDEFIKLANNIYIATNFLCEDYPNYKDWFFNKQLPQTAENERNILFIRNPENKEEIISVTCLKKDKEERKICTIYVSDKYRNQGIGSLILDESIKWLEDTKPLITLAEYKLDMFKPIIKKYNWSLEEIIPNLYNNNSNELIFNKKITKQKYIKTLKYNLDNKKD